MTDRDIDDCCRATAVRARALLGMAMLIAAPGILGAAEPGYDRAGLDAGQSKLAGRMLTFIETMDAMHLGWVSRLNGNTDFTSKSWKDDSADYDVRVWRGPVIEKTGFTTSVTKLGIAPYTEDAIWSRVVTINSHPATPLAGYFHGFVAFQYNTNGTSSIGGWMDIIPSVSNDEDLAYIRQRVDRVFEKFEVDPAPYRRAVCSGQRQEHLGPACVGVSFYAPPFLDITEQNLNLVLETFAALFGAYTVVVDKRMDQPYSESDLSAQENLRRKWLEDQMLYDPYAQNVIPHAVRSFANYPPSVKYYYSVNLYPRVK